MKQISESLENITEQVREAREHPKCPDCKLQMKDMDDGAFKCHECGFFQHEHDEIDCTKYYKSGRCDFFDMMLPDDKAASCGQAREKGICPLGKNIKKEE